MRVFSLSLAFLLSAHLFTFQTLGLGSECFKQSIAGLLYDLKAMNPKFIGEEHGIEVDRMRFSVQYLSEKDRSSYEIAIRDGLLVDQSGVPFTTETLKGSDQEISFQKLIGSKPSIYVQTYEGKLYISDRSVPGKFHHSSLVAGSPVAAAGEVHIKNGKVLLINALSGHYLPREENVVQLLQTLHEQGVDLSHIHYVDIRGPSQVNIETVIRELPRLRVLRTGSVPEAVSTSKVLLTESPGIRTTRFLFMNELRKLYSLGSSAQRERSLQIMAAVFNDAEIAKAQGQHIFYALLGTQVRHLEIVDQMIKSMGWNPIALDALLEAFAKQISQDRLGHIERLGSSTHKMLRDKLRERLLTTRKPSELLENSAIQRVLGDAF